MHPLQCVKFVSLVCMGIQHITRLTSKDDSYLKFFIDYILSSSPQDINVPFPYQFAKLVCTTHCNVLRLQLYFSCHLASEKSKEMFDEAMTHGYVEARDIKALIFGAAGTGKSHTIALLMDEEPPTIRRSTPCATRPVRVDKLEEKGGKWVRVTHDQLSQTIADTSTMLPQKPSTARKATSPASYSAPSSNTLTPVRASKSKTVSKSETASKHGQSAASIPHGKSSSVSTSSAENELLRRIEMSPYGRRAKKAFKRDRITLIDTGGQPQFHEVLPMFMRDTSASMFTIKLDDGLDDHPLIEFYDDSGNLIGSYRSPFTNQQILMMCMRVIQSQVSQSQEGLGPTPIFVGTHKDLEDQCPEPREEKNQKIHKMLPPAVQDNAIYCGEGLKEVIFAVNAKTPGPQEKKIAAELRRVIVEKSHVKPKQIPLRWHALELALQKLMLELGRGVLSKAECLEVAQRFHFTNESFEEALKYLDNLSILFYYKDVLPNVIFCDPQVLLDKVTELVEHSYRLQTAACKDIAAEGRLRKFRDQGIITLDFLRKKEFGRHYVQGLFSPVELLKLFKKLLIVSEISEEEFLMPCLLRVTDEPTLLAPSSSVPSLLFYFPHSPLLGVFCALIAYLLSQAKWKLLFDASSRSPVKVDRNAVQFEVPGDLPGVITLSDSFSTYFQVSTQLPEKAPRALYSAVLPQIRETIVAGIRKASSALHYNNSVPKDAFLCLEHNDSFSAMPHASIVDSTRTVMTCTLNPAKLCTTLTEEHLVWFRSSDTPGEQSQHKCLSSTLFCQDSVNSVL